MLYPVALVGALRQMRKKCSFKNEVLSLKCMVYKMHFTFYILYITSFLKVLPKSPRQATS